jgi:hypothetical protein
VVIGTEVSPARASGLTGLNGASFRRVAPLAARLHTPASLAAQAPAPALEAAVQARSLQGTAFAIARGEGVIVLVRGPDSPVSGPSRCIGSDSI